MNILNPFNLLTSEQIDEDETFVKFFMPDTLEIMEKKVDVLWNRLNFFRSSPGGGKTTLLRVFRPNTLNYILSFRDNKDQRKKLVSRLVDIGALDDNPLRIALLGIYISAKSNYTDIDQLDLPETSRKNLLISLITSRTILDGLNGLAILTNNSSPENIENINFRLNGTTRSFRRLIGSERGLITAKELYSSVADIEMRVCDLLDGYDHKKQMNNLFYGIEPLNIFHPDNILMKNQQDCAIKKTVIMIDDFHELTDFQRGVVIDEIINKRLNLGFWIAERLQSLSDVDFFKFTTPKRDFTVVNLEDYWEQHKKRSTFDNVLSIIANQRFQLNPRFSILNFENILIDSIRDSDVDWNKIIDSIKKKVNKFKGNHNSNLFSYVDSKSKKCNKMELAILWKSLEIIIERKIRQKQKAITQFFAISPEKVSDEDLEEFKKNLKDSSIRMAAELFIHNEHKVPFYFGFKRLSKSSFYNIEQFLWLSASLYDYVYSKYIMEHISEISPSEQEEILKNSIDERWKNLDKTIPDGYLVVRFLKKVCEFCYEQTYQPNAPYSPGVNGFAITNQNLIRLENYSKNSKQHRKLKEIIVTCLKTNLLRKKVSQRKGGLTIFYVNRYLCIIHDLPLGYGRYRTIKEFRQLISWITNDGANKI